MTLPSVADFPIFCIIITDGLAKAPVTKENAAQKRKNKLIYEFALNSQSWKGKKGGE